MIFFPWPTALMKALRWLDFGIFSMGYGYFQVLRLFFLPNFPDPTFISFDKFSRLRYSSGFLRRSQKFDKISQLIWQSLNNCQSNCDNSSNFCGLLRKPELYCSKKYNTKIRTSTFSKSYEIKLTSQAFLDGRSLPWRKLKQVLIFNRENLQNFKSQKGPRR